MVKKTKKNLEPEGSYWTPTKQLCLYLINKFRITITQGVPPPASDTAEI